MNSESISCPHQFLVANTNTVIWHMTKLKYSKILMLSQVIFLVQYEEAEALGSEMMP